MLFSGLALFLSYPLLFLRLSGSESSFPKPLSPAEEQDCLQRAAAGDSAARDKLIEHNLRLVAHIVKKYYSQTCEQDDLISIGTVGLIKGISTYRADKGVRLATYASRCIENELLMYLRAARKTAGDVSLSDSLDADGEGGGLSLMDVVSVEDDILDNLSTAEETRRLRACVNTVLDDREREIITLRYGLGGKPPMTQREAAARLGISRSYISRLEKRALEKLRAVLERDNLV